MTHRSDIPPMKVSMMSAELLGALEQVVSKAVRSKGTYKKRVDGSSRAWGGVNIVMCADFWQLHPVSGTFLASDPCPIPAGCAQNALEMFWLSGRDHIRALWQLTQLMRCDDTWYNAFLGKCRVGNLPMEDYNFFHGSPTLHHHAHRTAHATTTYRATLSSVLIAVAGENAY